MLELTVSRHTVYTVMYYLLQCRDSLFVIFFKDTFFTVITQDSVINNNQVCSHHLLNICWLNLHTDKKLLLFNVLQGCLDDLCMEFNVGKLKCIKLGYKMSY